jgi:hypothetical protein
VFLDVAKTFDTIWIDGPLYKLIILHFPSYLVQITSSYLRVGRFRRPTERPRHPVTACGLG